MASSIRHQGHHGHTSACKYQMYSAYLFFNSARCLQDDGHIFCLPDQIAAEIQGVLDMVEFMMGAFGFSKLEINLSTRPAKAVGSDEIWEKAENALKQALQAKVLPVLHFLSRSSCQAS